VGRGFDVAAPGKLDTVPLHQLGSSTGPAPGTLQGPKPARFEGQPVNLVGERLIGNRLRLVAAGGYDQTTGRKSPRQLSHPSSDATTHRREVVGEEELQADLGSGEQ
ncbi:MAG TPA: hypothetical protein VIM84_10025, partial [Gemmatimonadales bacterium]